MNSPVGSGIVLGGCRLSQTWNNEILDSLIDQLRSELEPTQRMVGWIGLGPKLWLKYHACPPRGPQIHGMWSVLQVVERLAPWFVSPVAVLGPKGLQNWQAGPANQGQQARMESSKAQAGPHCNNADWHYYNIVRSHAGSSNIVL